MLILLTSYPEGKAASDLENPSFQELGTAGMGKMGVSHTCFGECHLFYVWDRRGLIHVFRQLFLLLFSVASL